jgi:DNA-binding MarR family transcriptional regulator
MSIEAPGRERMMDPTTLNRKPLQPQGLVKDAIDAADGRIRITDKGRRTLEKAVPFWRQAQAQVKRALGDEALNGLLDRSTSKLDGPA